MSDDTILGLKAGTVLSGLLGAALSMRAIADARPINRITSMLAAAGAAGYLTPALAEYFQMSQALENTTSFIVGLLILNFTAGLITLSSKFAKDPVGASLDLIGLVFRVRGIQPQKQEGDRHERND